MLTIATPTSRSITCLPEMDRYEGVIIVSTNMKGNLDQAFMRRFSHVVDIPCPTKGFARLFGESRFRRKRRSPPM